MALKFGSTLPRHWNTLSTLLRENLEKSLCMAKHTSRSKGQPIGRLSFIPGTYRPRNQVQNSILKLIQKWQTCWCLCEAVRCRSPDTSKVSQHCCRHKRSVFRILLRMEYHRE